MKTVAIVVVVLVVLLVIVLAVLAGRRNSRRAALRERFGPEYDLALKRGKDRRAVEQRLEQLAKQRDQLDIREVPVQEHVRLAREWDATQSRFVDDPGQAVADADGLVNSVLRSRGYPVESFDDRAALLATDHQDVVEGYRGAHDTFAGHLKGDSADTEALRKAFVQYREVFGRLNVPDGEVRNAREQEAVTAAPERREVEAAAAPGVVEIPAERPVDTDAPAERPVDMDAPAERPVDVDRRQDEERVDVNAREDVEPVDVERPVDVDRREEAVVDRREHTVVDLRDNPRAAADRGEDAEPPVEVDQREHTVVNRPVDADRHEDSVVDLRDDARAAEDRGEDAAVDRGEHAALDSPADQSEAAVEGDDRPRQRRVAAHRADPA